MKVVDKILGVFYLISIMASWFALWSSWTIYLFTILLLTTQILLRQGILNLRFSLLFISVIVGTFTDGVFIQEVLLSLTFFTFPFCREILYQQLQVLKNIKNIAITMCFFFMVYSYFMTFMYQAVLRNQAFFSNFGWSSLTLLQVLSGDAWGEVGRQVDFTVGQKLITASFLLGTFIFVMTYFYMNICVGVVLETFQEIKQNHTGTMQNSMFQEAQRMWTESKLDDLILGKIYQYVIIAFSFITLCATVAHDFQPFDQSYEVYGGQIDDIAYTIHFIMLYLRQGKIYKFERESKLMMTVHFISGPLSLAVSLFLDQTLGSLLNLTKLATTPIVKGIFKGTFNILNTVYAPVLCLLNMTVMISSYFTMNYNIFLGLKQQLYWNHLWSSFYTFFQVLTFDDWASFILPSFSHQVVLPYIVFPLYIFLSNFILLNTFIALSCEYFIEVEIGSVQKSAYLQRLHRHHSQIPYLIQKLQQKNSHYHLVKVNRDRYQTEQEIQLAQDILGSNSKITRIEYQGQSISLHPPDFVCD